MSLLNFRRGRIDQLIGNHYAPSQATVITYKAGAQVRGNQGPVNTFTVLAGHGFPAAGSVSFCVMRYSGGTWAMVASSLRAVSSSTPTTVVFTGATLTVLDGDYLVNLGNDVGSAGVPLFTASSAAIYPTGYDGGTAVPQSRLTPNTQGEYFYYTAETNVWELVVSGSTPVELYPGVRFLATTGILSVKDFGALGDGTTDDAAAIQAALDAVTSAGAKVYFPAGTYIVGAAVWIKSKTHVYGDGIDVTVIKRKTNSLISLSSAVNTNKILMCGSASGTVYTNLSPGASISITDLTVDGDYANQTVTAGFGPDGIGTGQTVGADTGGCIDGFTVQRVKVTGVKGDGIRVRNSRNVLIDSCVLYLTGQIAAVDSKNSITLTGGNTERAAGWCTNAVISNNRISYSGDATFRVAEGIVLVYWSNVAISGNDISHVDYAIELTNSSGSYTTANVSITGNVIHDLVDSVAAAGIGIAAGLTSTTAHKGLTVSGNSFYNLNNNGVYLTFVDSAEIVGNTFRQTNKDVTLSTYATCVQLVDCSNFNISGNLLKMDSAAAGVYGIIAQGFSGTISDGVIAANTIISAPVSGILLSGGCSKVLVHGNKTLGGITGIKINTGATNTLNAVIGNYVTGYSSAGVLDSSSGTNYIVDYDQSGSYPIVHLKNQLLKVTGVDFINAIVLQGATALSSRSPRVYFSDTQASPKTLALSKNGDYLALTNNAAADALKFGDQGDIIASPGSTGGTITRGYAEENLVLSTGGTTTNTSANLLPAGAIIIAVVARVTTTIATATDWKLGDSTTAARFCAAQSGAQLTSGATVVGLDHMSGAVTTLAAGPSQAAAATVRVTTTGTPSAGRIRIGVHYYQVVAPTS